MMRSGWGDDFVLPGGPILFYASAGPPTVGPAADVFTLRDPRPFSCWDRLLSSTGLLAGHRQVSVNDLVHGAVHLCPHSIQIHVCPLGSELETHALLKS